MTLSFAPFLSDEENPKRFAAAAPITDAPVVDEPPSQKVDPATKSPKAPRKPVKKVVTVRSSMRVKKSPDAGDSLEAHRSMSSSDDVREYSGIFASIFCLLILTYCFWTELDEEICRLGQ
jgi:hypothetical protein